jgi:putative hydrolase of the HAD superfamily
MDHFGSRGKNCLYVGDNPQKDFYGARILGWKTVQIKRPDGIYKDEKNVRSDYMADILITDLNQLTSIIELS